MKKLFLTICLCLSGLSHAQANQGAWGLYDYELVEYQMAYNRSEVRSIASITKLFTATTILREGLDLDEKVKVTGKSGGRFSRGSMVPRIALMKAMLISSDNLAAETLANTYPGGFNAFIADTNQWVQGTGLISTKIVDASGLLAGNVSTIDNLIALLHRIKDNSVIREISNERTTTLKLPKGKKTVKINLRNTNPALFQFDNIVISKTGFTNPAGRCVAMLVRKEDRLYAVVVLGQPNVKERSQLANELISKEPIQQAPPVYQTIEFAFPL
jgi:serine-type D-Ala-D-Ala endopeptidase (penicillin-binding protein 7)